MNYMNLYYKQAYLDIIQELSDDFMKLENKVIRLLSDEQKEQWKSLIYDIKN